MIEYILSGLIAGLIPLIGIYIYLKKGLFHEFMQENIAIFLSEASNNAELQKELFTIGGLLGQGLKTGMGITKKGGKYAVQDFILQLAQQYFLKGQPGQPTSSIQQRSSDERDTFKL